MLSHYRNKNIKTTHLVRGPNGKNVMFPINMKLDRIAQECQKAWGKGGLHGLGMNCWQWVRIPKAGVGL